MEVAATYIFRRMKKSLTLEFFLYGALFLCSVYSNISRVEKNGPSEEKKSCMVGDYKWSPFLSCYMPINSLSTFKGVNLYFVAFLVSTLFFVSMSRDSCKTCLAMLFLSKPKVIYYHPSTSVVKNKFYCVTILYDGMRNKGKNAHSLHEFGVSWSKLLHADFCF